MLVKTYANQRIKFGRGPFQILRNFPGINLGNPNDQGIAGLGCIDHSVVAPDFTVKMHEHRNDEILSYIRQGKVSHLDKREGAEPVVNSVTHLMLMNAGKSFWHEEKTLGNEALVNMQIFVRPKDADLEPAIQFYPLATEKSINEWRLIAGPAASQAPMKFRSGVWFYDTHLAKSAINIPSTRETTGYLYLINGAMTVSEENLELHEGDGLVIKNEDIQISTTEGADLMFFIIDESAAYSRSGTMSG